MIKRMSLVLLLTTLSAFSPQARGEDPPTSPAWIPLWEKGAPGAERPTSRQAVPAAGGWASAMA